MTNKPVTAQSFTAGSADIAGTVVAFETGSVEVPVKASFGVSVVGSTCGVYGQGTGGPQQNRRKAPEGTGVLGKGDSYGVYGVHNSVPEFEIPDFSEYTGLAASIAVVGINSDAETAPAVFGDNNILKSDIDDHPEVRSAISEGAQLPIGVEGVSWFGHGVYGISLNLSISKESPADPAMKVVGGIDETASGRIPDAITTSLPADTQPAGVLGLSMQGAGVRGVSRTDRGGIFQSVTTRSATDQPVVAQIRLVPHRVVLDRAAINPVLPRHGQTGDVLAVVYPDPNLPNEGANLWFCQRGESTTGPAVWRKVSLADSVLGSGP
jgi:hypothetical protein